MTMLLEAADAESTSPEVRVAVSVMVSALVYWTVVSVTEVVPAAIVPVRPESVPPVPLPEWLLTPRATSVAADTLAAFPLAS